MRQAEQQLLLRGDDMGVSKVEFGQETLIDLTKDTVNSQNLLSGATAHGADGEMVKGSVVVPTKVSELENDSNYAKVESPTFTGTAKAPTPPANTNNTQIATTAFVKTLISNLINGAPETLDTLKEIADALGENDDAVQALNAAIGNKADKSAIPTKTSQLTNDSGFAVPGEKAGIFTGNEGGNIYIIAPDGTRWEMDAAENGRFRLFKYDPLVFPLVIDKSGVIIPKKIGSIGFVKGASGNVFTSASGAILRAHFYAVRIDDTYILKLDGKIEKEPDVRASNNYLARIDRQYVLNALGMQTTLNIYDSTCQYFGVNDNFLSGYVDNGGCLQTAEGNWIAARHYSSQMLIGGWPTSAAIYNLNSQWHVEAVLQ